MPSLTVSLIACLILRCNISLCEQTYTEVTTIGNRLNVGNTTSIPLVGDKVVQGTYPDPYWQYYQLHSTVDDSRTYTIGNNSRHELFELISTSLSTSYDDYRTVNEWNYTWQGFLDSVVKVTNTLLQNRDDVMGGTDIILGLAYREETYVRVRWEWYILPLALNLITAVVFLLTALQSARKPYLFKSSLLAVLFHGLDHVDAGHPKQGKSGESFKSQTIADLEARSRTLQVKFGRNQEGELKMLKAD